MIKILMIEDEPAYVEALEVALAREGFQLESSSDGRAGLAKFRADPPDLVLLDLMLPEMPGLDVLRHIRKQAKTPVIVLSAKDAESDVVTALELGADDYVTKPYSIRELVARMRAALRRTVDQEADEVISVGSAILDRSRYQLRVDHLVFDLPRKEFEVAQMLMGRAGRIVTREHLLDEVWGYGWDDSKTLDQHIRRIRRKLEQGESSTSPTITTIRGVGYRLEA